jgi:glyoxylase-like metal-dependent hydrolase (beta-lactamase superfamily II)
MQITSTIHALTIPFAVMTSGGPIPRTVNVYLLCGEEVTLIDSGVAGSEEPIFAYLESIGRRREIARLLLTHSHPDHIGAARALRAATGCAVVAAAAERCWIEDTARQARERPVPGFDTLVGGPVPVDRVVGDGEVVALGGGLSLNVIATPGHSAGSLSFFLRQEGALFTGDAVPLPRDLPIYDDYGQSLATLERLAAIDCGLLLEAWSEPGTSLPGQRLAAGAAWLQEIDAAVGSAQADGSSAEAMELCRQVVARLSLPPVAVNPLVARSLRSHRMMR